MYKRNSRSFDGDVCSHLCEKRKINDRYPTCRAAGYKLGRRHFGDYFLAELCNGSTYDSDSYCLGSNPSSAATSRWISRFIPDRATERVFLIAPSSFFFLLFAGARLRRDLFKSQTFRFGRLLHVGASSQIKARKLCLRGLTFLHCSSSSAKRHAWEPVHLQARARWFPAAATFLRVLNLKA